MIQNDTKTGQSEKNVFYSKSYIFYSEINVYQARFTVVENNVKTR